MICPEKGSSGFSLEGFTDGWKRDVKFSRKRMTEALDLETIRTSKSTIEFYGQLRDSQFKQYSSTVQHWEKVCETFTERALTLPSDRALAISGIAQIFVETSRDQYTPGLWKSRFHSGLLWKIEHIHLNPKDIPPPTIYQVTSWSWLSVTGTVKFSSLCKPFECVAEIRSRETKPANETAPYGLTFEGSGRLVLAARTASGARKKTPLRSPGKYEDEVMIIGFGKSIVCYAFAEMHCDVENAAIDKEEEAAGCLVAEISRRNDRDKLFC